MWSPVLAAGLFFCRDTVTARRSLMTSGPRPQKRNGSRALLSKTCGETAPTGGARRQAASERWCRADGVARLSAVVPANVPAFARWVRFAGSRARAGGAEIPRPGIGSAPPVGFRRSGAQPAWWRRRSDHRDGFAIDAQVFEDGLEHAEA